MVSLSVFQLLFAYCSGLEILAFPCNQFGSQEPGTNEEIQEFVCTRFKAEYPVFDKVRFIKELNCTCSMYFCSRFCMSVKSFNIIRDEAGDC